MSVPGSSSTAPVPCGRRSALLGVLVVAAGLALTIAGSLATGPCFDEERRVAATRHATDLARAITDYGVSSVVSGSARAIYEELAPFGVPAGLLSGWLGEVLSRAHLVDGVTASRIGWLLFTGLAPGALFFLAERGRGARAAALAASLLIAMPRWMHAASAAREPAIVASCWLLVLAAYVRSLTPSLAVRRATGARASWLAGVAFAVFLAVGASLDLATLWVLPIIVAHYSWGRRGAAWSAMRTGYAPLPAAFLWTVGVLPVALLLVTPQLWRGGAVSAAEWLFAPLAPTIEPLSYRGVVVSASSVPAAYAAHFLLATIPVSLLLLAGAGAVVMARGALAARRSGSPSDPAALGVLCLLSILAVLIGPVLTPRVFVRFPPRTELALPFVAIVAAIGLEHVAIRVVGARRAPWALLGSALIAMVAGLSSLPTASSSFNVLSRGTKGAVAGGVFTVGDGSEVAVLARAIDQLHASSVGIQSTEVPRAYWTLLAQTGWLRTRVDTFPGSAGLVVGRGMRQTPLAVVDRGGAPLWFLARR